MVTFEDGNVCECRLIPGTESINDDPGRDIRFVLISVFADYASSERHSDDAQDQGEYHEDDHDKADADFAAPSLSVHHLLGILTLIGAGPKVRLRGVTLNSGYWIGRCLLDFLVERDAGESHHWSSIHLLDSGQWIHRVVVEGSGIWLSIGRLHRLVNDALRVGSLYADGCTCSGHANRLADSSCEGWVGL